MADLPPFEDRVKRVLAIAYAGIHHVPGWDKRKPYGDGLTVTVFQDLATYDFDRLTRLVVAAHDHCVRLQIDSGGPRHLALRFWPRQREGDITRRHPTMEDAMASIRQSGW